VFVVLIFDIIMYYITHTRLFAIFITAQAVGIAKRGEGAADNMRDDTLLGNGCGNQEWGIFFKAILYLIRKMGIGTDLRLFCDAVLCILLIIR